MTLHIDVREKFDQFCAKYKNAECSGDLKKQFLVELRQVYDATEGLRWPPSKNLGKWVSDHVRISRGKVIKPQFTNKTKVKHVIGSCNSKGKARVTKYNAVHNARRMYEVRAKAQAALEAMGGEEKFLTQEKADEIVDDLLAENKTIFESLRNQKCSAYVCYSASDMKKECTCFASNRGGRKWNDESEHLRPNAPDPNIFTNSQFFHILGAKCDVLYKSSLKYNARTIEDTIQGRFMNIKVGYRLWKNVDLTPSYEYDLDETKEKKLHQVAVLHSEKIPGMIDDKIIDLHYHKM